MIVAYNGGVSLTIKVQTCVSFEFTEQNALLQAMNSIYRSIFIIKFLEGKILTNNRLWLTVGTGRIIFLRKVEKIRHLQTIIHQQNTSKV